MNAPWQLICLVFALVLFAIAGFGWPAPVEPWRTRLIGAGLFFYILSMLVNGGVR